MQKNGTSTVFKKYANDEKFGKELLQEVPKHTSKRRKKGIKATAILPVGETVVIWISKIQFSDNIPKIPTGFYKVKVKILSAPTKGDIKAVYTFEIIEIFSIFTRNQNNLSGYIGRKFITPVKGLCVDKQSQYIPKVKNKS